MRAQPSSVTAVRLARDAMRVRFELALYGDSGPVLTAAGEEALEEVSRVEAQLSAYRPGSDLFEINARGAETPVRVLPLTLAFLRRAFALSAATSGVFDPTIGALRDAWERAGSEGCLPSADDLSAARARTSPGLVRLDEDESTVALARPGVRLDPGAIGKGWALDRAAQDLRAAGVTSALLHGGTSTVVAIGAPPGGVAWTVAVEDTGRTAMLRDGALSVSAGHGKGFVVGGTFYGHVLDPRTGGPVQGARLAAVVAPSATDTDALSTALLVLGAAGIGRLAARFPDAAFLVQEVGGAIVTRRWPA